MKLKEKTTEQKRRQLKMEGLSFGINSPQTGWLVV